MRRRDTEALMLNVTNLLPDYSSAILPVSGGRDGDNPLSSQSPRALPFQRYQAASPHGLPMVPSPSTTSHSCPECPSPRLPTMSLPTVPPYAATSRTLHVEERGLMNERQGEA